jgi:hypothetical protein
MVSGLAFLLGAPSAPVAQEGRSLSAAQRASLQRFCYLLFPYPELGNPPYDRVVESLVAQSSGDAETLALLTASLAQLDTLVEESNFLSAAEDAQIEAMKRIEHGEFFQWVLASTRQQLFNDKVVWAFIGYEGSSLEFGGYRNRGLNDIDWL